MVLMVELYKKNEMVLKVVVMMVMFQ